MVTLVGIMTAVAVGGVGLAYVAQEPDRLTRLTDRLMDRTESEDLQRVKQDLRDATRELRAGDRAKGQAFASKCWDDIIIDRGYKPDNIAVIANDQCDCRSLVDFETIQGCDTRLMLLMSEEL